MKVRKLSAGERMITRFTYMLKKMCHGSHKLNQHSTFSAHAVHSFNVPVLRYKTAGIHLQGDSQYTQPPHGR